MTLPGRYLVHYANDIMYPVEIWSPDGTEIASRASRDEFLKMVESDHIWGRGSKTRLRQVFWHERPFIERRVWKQIRRLPQSDKYVYRQKLAETWTVWAFRQWKIRWMEEQYGISRHGENKTI